MKPGFSKVKHRFFTSLLFFIIGSAQAENYIAFTNANVITMLDDKLRVSHGCYVQGNAPAPAPGRLEWLWPHPAQARRFLKASQRAKKLCGRLHKIFKIWRGVNRHGVPGARRGKLGPPF